jgi:hypothetical protein
VLRGLTGFWRFEVQGSRFKAADTTVRRGGGRRYRSFRLRLLSGLRQSGADMARINAGHIRFLTQRAARARAGFEAPSQRRDVGHHVSASSSLDIRRSEFEVL